MMATIHCKFDEMVKINDLKDNPKNPNRHGNDQIERLAELYKYHGVRHPIIVSKRSGFICVGHGRKLAAIRAGLKDFPVVYQDFENEEQEYSFMVADNAISDWSLLDFQMIKADVLDLGPDFDIGNLGIKNFTLDSFEKEFDPDSEGEIDDKPEKRCPHCGEII